MYTSTRYIIKIYIFLWFFCYLHLPLPSFRVLVDIIWFVMQHTLPKPTRHMTSWESTSTSERARLFRLVSLGLSAFVFLFTSHSRSPSVFFSMFFVLFYSTFAGGSSLCCFLRCYSYPVRWHFVCFPLLFSIICFWFICFTESDHVICTRYLSRMKDHEEHWVFCWWRWAERTCLMLSQHTMLYDRVMLLPLWSMQETKGKNPQHQRRLYSGYVFFILNWYFHPSSSNTTTDAWWRQTLVVINHEIKIHIANTARWLGHAMPTSMTTRARNKTFASQHGLFFCSKKEEKKSWMRMTKRKSQLERRRETGRHDK